MLNFSTILLVEGEIHLFISGAASLAIGSLRREVLHARSSSSAARLATPRLVTSRRACAPRLAGMSRAHTYALIFVDHERLINLGLINESLTEAPLSETLESGMFADSVVDYGPGPLHRRHI